jgi:hypothetical protein
MIGVSMDNLSKKPGEGLVTLSVYERHSDVKKPEERVGPVLYARRRAERCPRHPLSNAVSPQWVVIWKACP